jgi:purine-nucleoside phosphorylase
MENIHLKAKKAKEFISSQSKISPELAIIFGSGLNSEELFDDIDIRLPYNQIPLFPVSTVENHKGELIIGKRKGKGIYLFSGRFHYYEGYSAREIAFPVRVMQLMGLKNLILTNAAGGINPDFNAGDVILLKDHINMIPDNPLRGKDALNFGPRFPDMSKAYDPEFRKQVQSIAQNQEYNLKEGVYLAFQGPSLETPAEYTMIYRLGGDLIGMSTVLEAIAAVQGGIKVGGFSVVSNECYPPERIKETTHQDVVKTVKKSEHVLLSLISEWIDKYL